VHGGRGGKGHKGRRGKISSDVERKRKYTGRKTVYVLSKILTFDP
jgi:hypothetical protein